MEENRASNIMPLQPTASNVTWSDMTWTDLTRHDLIIKLHASYCFLGGFFILVTHLVVVFQLFTRTYLSVLDVVEYKVKHRFVSMLISRQTDIHISYASMYRSFTVYYDSKLCLWKHIKYISNICSHRIIYYNRLFCTCSLITTGGIVCHVIVRFTNHNPSLTLNLTSR